MSALNRLIQVLLEPIAGDSPCGVNLRYDERYDALKNEVNRLSGAAAGAPDWQKIRRLSEELLRKSKDINLVGYLAISWIHDYGAEGLIGATVLLDDLLRHFWDDLYPTRLRARQRALVFVYNKMTEANNLEPCTDDALILDGIEACNGITERMFDVFEDPPVSFKEVRSRIQDWKNLAPPTRVDEPEVAESQPAAEAPAVASSPSPRMFEEIPDDASIDQVFEFLEDAATFIFKDDPTNATACLLKRLSLWHGAKEPTAEFPDPEAFRVDALENLRKNNEWEALYVRAESLFSERWFWLDLQYYAALAAEGMDENMLLRNIERATLDLITRLPSLQDLKFAQGMPFASSDTKSWLARLGARDLGQAAPPDDPALVLQGEMRRLGRDAFGDAVKLAQTAIDSAPNRREAFRLRLKAAEFCLEADQAMWADSLVRLMIDEMEAHQLAYWDPNLAIDAWSLVLAVARELMDRNESQYRAWESKAMQNLASLDLSRAARFFQ